MEKKAKVEGVMMSGEQIRWHNGCRRTLFEMHNKKESGKKRQEEESIVEIMLEKLWEFVQEYAPVSFRMNDYMYFCILSIYLFIYFHL